MLDTELLCERVRLPHQSPPRTLWFSQGTVVSARAISKALAAEGVKKSAGRVVGDMLTVTLEIRPWSGDMQEATFRAIAETDELPKAKFGVSLPESVWQNLDARAELLSRDTRVTPSQLVRALAHMATKQVHDEFTDR